MGAGAFTSTLRGVAASPHEAGMALDALRLLLLTELAAGRAEIVRLEERQKIRVKVARAAGLTWQQIADSLGVTNQAAQQRYGRGSK